MNPKTIASIILIVVGIVALSHQGFTYTTREKAIDLGPLQVTAEEKHTVPIPPILGGIALVAGIGLLVWNPKRG
jgi:di/tricarboxylate transporter